jgi:addiction module HigA family antidote
MAKQKLTPAGALKAKMDEYLISIPQLAADINLSPSQIRNFLSGNAKIGIQIALKLAKYFSTTFEYWNELQLACDLEEAKAALQNDLKNIPKAKKPTAKQLTAAQEAKDSKAARKRAKEESAKPAGRSRAKASDKKEAKDSPAKRGAKKAEAPVKRSRAPSKKAETAAPKKAVSRTRPGKKASPEPAEAPPAKPNTILIKKSQTSPQEPAESQGEGGQSDFFGGNDS